MQLTNTVEKQCNLVCWQLHLEFSNDRVFAPHICFHTFQLSATFPVVTNLPGGIIPAILPKDKCCTSPCCVCDYGVAFVPGDGALGAKESRFAAKQVDNLFNSLFNVLIR